jgi:hypothetical protein
MGSDNYGSDVKNGEVRDEDGGAEQTAELDLEHSFDNLPWLESDDDYDDQSVDTVRIVIIAILGLLAIGVVAGGVWWATQGRNSGDLIAQGGTIEAPEGPYKTKPEDAGGKTFAGTGDTSFAVAEGQTREGKIVTAPLPKPSIDLAGAETGQTTATAAQTAPVAGVGVQLGAYFNRADAESGWQTLSGQFEALQGQKHRVVEGQADIGRVYRLQVVAGDLAAANSLCRALMASGGRCQVKN